MIQSAPIYRLPMSRSTLVFALLTLWLGACQPVAPPVVTPTHTPHPTQTSTPSASPSPDGSETHEGAITASCPALTGNVLSELQTLERQVSQLRGLSPLDPIARQLLPPDEVQTRIVNEFLITYTAEQSEAESFLFHRLGLLPEDIDLRQLYADLLNEQLAGFYDPALDEMVIVCDGAFGGIERFTYAHEYVHTLQDQTFDVERSLAYNDADCEGDSQRCIAARALLEGDASLLQEQWLRQFSSEDDLDDLASFFSTFAMPVYESAPPFVQADFTFPYLEGLFFVRSQYLKDGWASVDQLYLNPPHSTEQILHPERYPWDEAIVFDAPPLSALEELGWEITFRYTLGEWILLQSLLPHLSEDDARLAAEGWGGDIVLLLENPLEDQTSVVQLVQWDTMRDAHEFTAAYKAYGQLRFGEADELTPTSAKWTGADFSIVLERQSNQTLILMGPADDLVSIRTALFLPFRPQP